ncbi:ATP-binding protein [Stieleria varia]|uniref:histidine kinase n=1 Tax=Stieleria varia TaxID=2528005 RepID=A0A5C6A1R2_9BACT|nr:ATP-binding protein [Stieleria varia]TWT93792.1 Sensor protein ZraS [Stieleria varia]
MASLYVVRGRDQGKHHVLSGALVRIGREASNEIQLLDSEASRHHAEIAIAGTGECVLADLSSSNGTKVNGARITSRQLRSGDRIEIGSSMMIFTGTGQPTAMNAAHGVDIVLQKGHADASRIVSSISQPLLGNNATSVGENESNASDSESSVSSLPTSDADRSLEVMYLTAIAVGRTDDLDELLNRILRLVFDWVEADRGCIMLRDNETGQLRPAGRCDRDHVAFDSQQRGPINISHTILDYVMERKEGVRTSDAKDDVRFDSAASIVQGGVREALCVPLQGRYDIVGALYIDTYTPPGQLIGSGARPRFTDDHLRLITAIGHQAALAIEDTSYYSALVQSERLAAMGQTIATLSHHVKNILQGIRGGSYLIEAGLERNDTDAVRRGWSMVDRNQERISNLVMDMLSFSKERVPQKVDSDLNDMVGEIAELMKTRASEMGVKLVSQISGELPTAKFDPDALHQAVLNLVTNAIDAAAGRLNDENADTDFHWDGDSGMVVAEAPPPTVEIQTGFDSELGWYVDVIDNGPGIAPEDREKIFSLFESRKGARGTGLGLPVSAKIMREHGGTIQIMPNDRSTGSRFRLTLPPQQDHGTDGDGAPTLL